MRLVNFLLVLILLLFAGSASAEMKSYDTSAENGTPGDTILTATEFCPPIITTPGVRFGYSFIEDDGLGTVSLENVQLSQGVTDIGPDFLESIFGPGAFVFISNSATVTNVGSGGSPHVSASGSGTDPGEIAVWGIVSGWTATGSQFCISSPVAICGGAGFVHGASVGPVIESGTYNLGTWAFDALGDYQASSYIERTVNGGLSNTQAVLRGAFTGSALPALPLVGAGALALSLAIIGGRSLIRLGAPQTRIMLVGMLNPMVAQTVQLAVPNLVSMIGTQATFQTITGPLGTQRDALTFPAMIVVTP